MLLQAANLVQHGQSCVADYLLKVRKLSPLTHHSHHLSATCELCCLPAMPNRLAPANAAMCSAPALFAGLVSAQGSPVSSSEMRCRLLGTT